MNSIWVEGTERPSFAKLTENIKTDVLIIGGGMAGILCGYMLKKAGVDCVLLEADRICGGVTQNTTAKISAQHGLLYHKLIKRFGEEKAKLYLQAQLDARDEYFKLCQGLGCDCQTKTSYVYSIDKPAKLEKELAALWRLGLKAEYVRSLPLPIKTAGAVAIANQGQFHPLKFALKLAEELAVYENTRVIKLLPDGVLTHRGKIRCKKTVVATHFPLFNARGGYFLKMYQHRSYVIALEGASDVDGIYVDDDDKGLSFRNYGNLLLLGGGAHRTGKKGGAWQELVAFARAHYGKAKLVCQWATQDCMTLDQVPYIGQYSKSTPNLYVATGFNKWGMTSSMVAAKLLTDLLLGKENDYAAVFSPSRSVFRPQLAINVAESLLGLLTPTVPRCPHLGCALKYNPYEHTWDCSCHGSRFTEEGRLINNPANRNKKIR